MDRREGRALYCGVDIGASNTKLVLLDQDEEPVARVVRHSGINYAATAQDSLQEALELAGAEMGDVRRAVSTGYGRSNVDFAGQRNTEIHCHSIGCFHLVDREMTVIDIGGQDNKIIHLDGNGQRKTFKMNRKCAAGTGAFIEEIAVRLGLPMDDLDRLAQRAEKMVPLGSFCTVFSKTEILSHLRAGQPVEGIVRGAFESVISRVVEMDTLEGEVVLTGGVVAHNPIIAQLLEARIGRAVIVPPFPQFTGALGAALIAARSSNPELAPENENA